MLNTVRKIGPVLDLFTADRPEWRLGDIARALDMPKSSVHALVTTLAEVGLLSVGQKGHYRLGWNLVSLAERVRASLNFSEHALPAMRQLSQELHETVLLAALDRSDVVYAERAQGDHPMVRLAGVGPGSRVPAHATSCGKVLLAQRSPAEVRALLGDGPLKGYTSTTIRTVEALEIELDQVRATGHAFDRNEIVPEVRCCAVPVRDHHGSVVAAMSVAMPAYRFPDDPDPLLIRMRVTADRIAVNLAGAARSEDVRRNSGLAAV